MTRIDLNCDMGEGMSNDALLMPYLSSANIACGAHAGDESLMEETIALAQRHGVAIGAHPGFDDPAHFGRREMNLSDAALHDLVAGQVLALKAMCSRADALLHHVKPHGALYNMAARDPELSRIIAGAVLEIDPNLVLYGLSGSHMVTEATKVGLRTASEVFADRTYQDDGSLTPRSQPGALIEEEIRSLAQVLTMLQDGWVLSVSGSRVRIVAETVCLHGDGAHALEFARRLYNSLVGQGIGVQRP